MGAGTSLDVSGVRLEIGSGTTFIEIGRTSQNRGPTKGFTPLSFMGDEIRLEEEVACEVLRTSAPEGCATTNLRARVVAKADDKEISVATPRDLNLSSSPGAQVAVLNAVTAPLAFPCSPEPVHLDVVAWSK